MTKKVWSFRQKDYIAKYQLTGMEEGVCLALAARWAKMHLKHGQRQLSSTDKTRYFEQAKPGKATVGAVIGEMQAAFDDARVPAQRKVAAASRTLEAIMFRNLGGELSDADYVRMKGDLEKYVIAHGAKVDNALQLLLGRQNLDVVRETKCNTFSDWLSGFEYDRCYVFRCVDLKHAFAARVTKGYLWDDYYLFDPNCGEMHFDGASQWASGTTALRNFFKVRGYAHRFQVAYRAN